ncbi:MAG: hypothetical protein OXB92_01430 [Acidimicrobiaceae bacterium]|nr:hypothetical protein [Acidimicrobiaceae bacterium]
MSHIVVFGAGATGTRIAQQLLADGRATNVEVRDTRRELPRQLVTRPRRLVDNREGRPEPVRGHHLDTSVDLAVLATPATNQAAIARRAVHQGVPVVATSNHLSEVRRLLGLHQEALHNQVPVVVGATFMPGLSCLFARHGATEFDQVDEIHVAKVGTGGPACARQHHAALSSVGLDWRDGRWTTRAPGSGRELAYFPDPIGGRDCYRGALPDALLLVPEFQGVQRVTARMAATRRDRLTSPLPMLRRPHPEGGLGAIRVELRGRVDGESRIRVFGAVERPAPAAAAVAVSAGLAVLKGGFCAGAYGLAGGADPLALLNDIAARGIRPLCFEGASMYGAGP